MKEVVDQHPVRRVLPGARPSETVPDVEHAPGAWSDDQTSPRVVAAAGGSQDAGRLIGTDPLAELGPILAAVAQRDREAADLATERAELAQRFLDDFAMVCVKEVRPAMGAVLDRLQQLGGDGLIEEHPGGEARYQEPRIALWMSLMDKIVGEPRPDRYPYLLLKADAQSRRVQVDEGDMWRGAGGYFSGRVGAWETTELTRERVTEELLAIAHRAAGEHPGSQEPIDPRAHAAAP